MDRRAHHLELGPRRFRLELPADLEDDAYQPRDGGDSKPYWAFLWGSAVALARAIMEGPDLTGKRVIEVGAGLGLSSMAAAARGATVLATDIRPEAVRLLADNAAANGVIIDARVVDFYDPPADLGLFDAVLAADVIYHDGMLAGVVRFMRSHLAPGGWGVLTDPYRIMPAGVLGAARLNGFEVVATPLASPGSPVIMYVLERRARGLAVSAEVPREGAAAAPQAPNAKPDAAGAAPKAAKSKSAPAKGAKRKADSVRAKPKAAAKSKAPARAKAAKAPARAKAAKASTARAKAAKASKARAKPKAPRV